jgi:hypothetical protein
MKKFFFLFIFFTASAVVTAQSVEETNIAITLAALTKAMIDADQSTLDRLTTEDLSYGHSSGRVENKAEYIAAIMTGANDFSSIDITGQTIKLSGKNAIVRQTFSAKLMSDGKPLEVKIGIMMVWIKVKRQWKLLARQGFKI